MSDSQPLDLTSLISLQKQYAMDLKNIPNGNTQDTAAVINDLQNKLNDLNSSITNSNINADSVLYNQDVINNILKTENDRLMDKKQNIDTAISGQERIIALNNSYSKRYYSYTKIMTFIVIALGIALLLRYMGVSGSILTILYIIIFSLLIIYIVISLISISSRDKFNYDELNLPSPSIPSTTGTPTSQTFGPDVKSSFNLGQYCIGESCCDNVSNQFDSTLGICVPITATTTTSPSTTQTQQSGFTTMAGVQSFSPSEYDSYSKI